MAAMKRKRSCAWDYFEKAASDDSMAICQLCKKSVAHCNTTSNLFKHLQSNHKKEYDKCQEELKKDKEKKRKVDDQSKLDDMFTRSVRYPRTSARRQALDTSLLTMIATNMQPISIVEDKGFNTFVQQLDPRYQPPSRKTITQALLPKMYQEARQDMQTTLESIPNIALTTDIWSSNQTEGYMTVTAHGLTQAWEFKSFVLQTRQMSVAHTGINISQELKQCVEDWSIENKIVAISTDNASNACNAVQLCGWRHIPCLAHTVNLVVKAAINSCDDVVQVQKRIKDIVSYFHRSVKASDELKRIQAQLSLPEHKLIQDVETRWNATFYMVQRYIEQHSAITTALCLLNQNGMCITSDEVKLAEMMVEALTPFEIATRELCGEKYLSVSKVIPIVRQLQAVCRRKTNSPLAESLTSELRSRFTGIENSYVLAVASLCDPRFKKASFIDLQATEQTERRLVGEMASAHSDNDTADDSGQENTPRQEADEDHDSILWQAFDSQVSASTVQNHEVVDCSLELKLYYREKILARKEDPLQWWKEHEAKYPALAKVAKKYLGIPATSVASERVFSKAGELISKRRSRLKSKNVDILLFLNQNINANED